MSVIKRDFFWAGGDNRVGSHLVNWVVVSLPLCQGGLGIGGSKHRNAALLTKNEENAFWRQVVASIYGEDPHGWLVSRFTRAPRIDLGWTSLRWCLYMRSSSGLKLGMGNTLVFGRTNGWARP